MTSENLDSPWRPWSREWPAAAQRGVRTGRRRIKGIEKMISAVLAKGRQTGYYGADSTLKLWIAASLAGFDWRCCTPNTPCDTYLFFHRFQLAP
jgi:hypothetical protein